MASILKIGGKWRAQLRSKCLPRIARTFDTREEAVAWASGYEERAKPVCLPEEIASLERYIPQESIGIYFLFYKDACVYVGKSMNVHCRIKAHIGRIPFETYSWVRAAPEKLDELEAKYIAAILPLFNVSMNYERAKAIGWVKAKAKQNKKSVALNLLHQA